MPPKFRNSAAYAEEKLKITIRVNQYKLFYGTLQTSVVSGSRKSFLYKQRL